MLSWQHCSFFYLKILYLIEFEAYDLVMYEPVVMVDDLFAYKSLVLIGGFFIRPSSGSGCGD